MCNFIMVSVRVLESAVLKRVSSLLDLLDNVAQVASALCKMKMGYGMWGLMVCTLANARSVAKISAKLKREGQTQISLNIVLKHEAYNNGNPFSVLVKNPDQITENYNKTKQD